MRTRTVTRVSEEVRTVLMARCNVHLNVCVAWWDATKGTERYSRGNHKLMVRKDDQHDVLNEALRMWITGEDW